MRPDAPLTAAGRPCSFAAALALALCGSGAGLAREKVVVSFQREIYAADLLIAIDEGYFAAQDLEVETVAWSNSTAMLPALAHGELDFSTTSSLSPSYINLIQRGAPIRLVAARSVHAVDACPYVAFVARTELIESGRLSDLQSLRGLRVATARTAPSFYYWARLLERAGLTPDDVVLKNVPDDLKVEAIARDLVDVTSTIEPKVTHLVESGDGKVWLPIAAATPDRQNTFLLFGPRLLEERRDLGRRVMDAYLAGRAQYLLGKTDRNVEILAKRTRLEPDQVRRICWPSQSADPHIDPAGLEDFQKWALGEGLIDAIVPFSSLVDEEFLRAAPRASSTP
jgi:ABC-type nitrate/sulfonate/bicarbonate transport system substrate-binding protein